MIKYNKHILDNGLTLIIHEDHTTPLAVVNTLYDVGSKNEHIEKTGFAHLFEHLMFGGSKNIKNFDDYLQQVGGDNNAFTSTDITNYYITLPAQNLETALWLESDRMLELSFDPKVLEVQRKVVIEEFKQRYLNQPYGDVWLKLRPLAYKVHPYQWPTIGKDISHIEEANMDDVKKFFFNFYAPDNAVLVIAGNIREKEVLEKVNKWYGNIPKRNVNKLPLPTEPKQNEYRRDEVRANVPLNAIYMVFHVPGRKDEYYHEADLLSDILGRGHSSRLYEDLVKKRPVFNSISANLSSSYEPGLLIVSGKLNPEQNVEEAEKEIWKILEDFKEKNIEDFEIEKVKNQAESTIIYGEAEVLHRAMNLAIATVLGDTELANTEIESVRSVTKEGILNISQTILQKENCSTLHYLSES